MKTVILAEKPSQAKAYADAMQKVYKKDGFFEVVDELFDKCVITYGFGHLVELQSPDFYDEKYKNWNIDTLPIFPKEFKYKVSKNKQKQFNIVKSQLKSANEIIIATDIDREGEAIARLIIMLAGCSNTKIKRLWINSLEKDSIRSGFKKLKDGKETYNYFIEAQTRAQADWLVGMNLSRLYSLNMQKYSDSYINFSIGRVQTPTLNMIYERNKEIKNFKPKTYKEIEADISTISNSFRGVLESKKQFFNKEELDQFLENINLDQLGGKITKIESKTKSTSSPKLFSLSTLQTKANSKFNASASETLQAVQKLYESKYLTYPRTDCQYITDQEYKYLKDNLDDYINFLAVKKDNFEFNVDNNYVNNKKVQEHHAIILTKTIPTKEKFEQLSKLEQQIYELVAKTTVAMFYPKYQYEETLITTQYQNFNFISKGQKPLNLGWKQIFNSVEQESLLPKNLSENMNVNIKLDIVEKETKPPKYFTEGSLITAMKTAGKLVENEDSAILDDVDGIGTEATRASIIDTLKKRKYIEVKNKKIFVTEDGELLCQYISKVNILKSPEMTAKWEKYLKNIGTSENSSEALSKQKNFIQNIQKFITHELNTSYTYLDNEELKQNIEIRNINSSQKDKNNEIGICSCGGKILDKGNFYGCSNYKNCIVGSIPKKFANHTFSKEEITDLFQNQKTTNSTWFNSKNNKKFKAFVEYIPKEKRLNLLFDNFK